MDKKVIVLLVVSVVVIGGIGFAGFASIGNDRKVFAQKQKAQQKMSPFEAREAKAKETRAERLVIHRRNAPYDAAIKIREKTAHINKNQQDYLKAHRFEAVMQARFAILDMLKSPRGAKWVTSPSRTDVRYKGKVWYVIGEVDAQNGFGAMIRNNYAVVLYHNGGDSFTVTDIAIAPR